MRQSKILTIPVLDWLRINTSPEFHNDINLVHWLINCEYINDVKSALKEEMSQGLLSGQKYIDKLNFINYLIERKN